MLYSATHSIQIQAPVTEGNDMSQSVRDLNPDVRREKEASAVGRPSRRPFMKRAWDLYLLLSLLLLMIMVLVYGVPGPALWFWEFVFAMAAVAAVWDMGFIKQRIGLFLIAGMLAVIAVAAPVVLRDLTQVAYFEVAVLAGLAFIAYVYRSRRAFA